jgi:hypothetical protein
MNTRTLVLLTALGMTPLDLMGQELAESCQEKSPASKDKAAASPTTSGGRCSRPLHTTRSATPLKSPQLANLLRAVQQSAA